MSILHPHILTFVVNTQPRAVFRAHFSQVTPEDLDKRAKELGVMSIETSAKAGHNVKTLFKKIAMALPGAEAKEEINTSELHWDASDPRN